MDTHPVDKILEAVFSSIENNIVPKTREGVKRGCKVFGASILAKKDLRLVRFQRDSLFSNEKAYRYRLY